MNAPPGGVARVHAGVCAQGWALTTSHALGLPPPEAVRAEFGTALAPDPRGPGKSHARDVVDYARMPPGAAAVGVTLLQEARSIAHGATDDFSRFPVLGAAAFSGVATCETVLRLVPPALRHPSGQMSADLFRYTPGTESSPHQDGFGDFVVIWVLGCGGAGAESFLTALDGRDVLRRRLAPGSVLAFRDGLFRHGVTPLLSGWRDVLVFITLRGTQPSAPLSPIAPVPVDSPGGERPEPRLHQWPVC